LIPELLYTLEHPALYNLVESENFSGYALIHGLLGTTASCHVWRVLAVLQVLLCNPSTSHTSWIETVNLTEEKVELLHTLNLPTQ
jgi:hypothetical protein